MSLTIHARRVLRHLLVINKPGFAVAIPADVCPTETVPSVRRELGALGFVYDGTEVDVSDTTICLLTDRTAEARRIDADYEDAEMQWALMQAVPPTVVERYLTDYLPDMLFNCEPVDREYAREQIAVLLQDNVIEGTRDAERDLIRARLTRKGKKLLRMETTPDGSDVPLVPSGNSLQIYGDVYDSPITQGTVNTVHVEFYGQIAHAVQAVEDSGLNAEVKEEVRAHLEAALKSVQTRPGVARRLLGTAREISVGALGGAGGQGIIAAIDAAIAAAPFLP